MVDLRSPGFRILPSFKISEVISVLIIFGGTYVALLVT